MVENTFNPSDQVANQPPDNGQGDTSQRFRDDYHTTVAKSTDKTSETGTAPGAQKFDNPYEHLNTATEAAKELSSLDGKKDSDKIQVEVAPGKMAEVTVGERRAELTKTADVEYKAALKAADNIDQKKVTDSIWELQNRETAIITRLKAAGLTDDQIKQDKDYKDNQDLQNAVMSMRQASSVTRFGYAQFLAEDKNDVLGAKKLIDKCIADNPEAKHEQHVQAFYHQLTSYIKQSQKDQATGESPFDTLEKADAKRQKGDLKGADAEYRKAIAEADKLPVKDVADALTQLKQQKAELSKDAKGNAAALKELEGKEQGLSLLAHAQAVARMNYADFLNSQKRFDESNKVLDAAAKADPTFAKTGDFAQLRAGANPDKATDKAADQQQQKPFDDPYAHYGKAQDALKAGNLKGAEEEMRAAVKSADGLDVKPFQAKIKEIDQKLAGTTDAAAKADLQKERDMYDQLAHSAAFMRMQLGRFELANKNFLAAKSLFLDVQHDDPDFANRPGVQMKDLMAATDQPSKLTETLKDIGKSVLCDAVAIGAGVLTGIATGWTGPGAILAGGAAGTAAYMGMRAWLYGEKPGFNKQTAINAVVGFADGATLGTAGLVADGLKEGAVLGTKEIAEQAVLKSGGKLAALESVEAAEGGAKGLKYFGEAEKLAKEGLAASKGSMTALELKEAKSALRALTMRNAVNKAYINAATAGSMSLVYRGAHEGANYYEGKYKSFADFSKSLATKVAIDTTAGVGFGAGFTYLGAPKAVGFDFLSKGATTFVAATPVTNELLSNTLPNAAADARALAYLNKPTDQNNLDEWLHLYNEAPGSFTYVSDSAPGATDNQVVDSVPAGTDTQVSDSTPVTTDPSAGTDIAANTDTPATDRRPAGSDNLQPTGNDPGDGTGNPDNQQ